MTPGPTRVPDRVLRAGARPMIHHRSPEFRAELAELLELIAPVFGTRAPVLPVHTTGRGAMEAAICNLFSPRNELVAICNGKFGEMWANLAASYGIVVHRVSTDWSLDVDMAALEDVFRSHPRSKGVLVSWCDTSTGVKNDVQSVARIAHSHDALVLVDGVSSLGGMPFVFDAWDIDVAVTASQKCLMSSPGLAFVALSERAWSASAHSTLPRNYWNFTDIKRNVSQSTPETPGTTPVHLVLQVAEALRMIAEEGLHATCRRHEVTAQRARDGVTQLGLSMQCPRLASYSPTVTAVALRGDVDPKLVRDGLTLRGILTAAAMGRYESSAFRIGHMGDIRSADIDRTLTALAEVLSELGRTMPQAARE